MNNPYQVPMMNNNYMPMQNPYADRLNFLQNYQQSLQQPMQMNQQPIPQRIAGISGRMVQSAENINANEVPMDGNVAFFPKQDLSEIYVKGWNADGTIKTIVYKPQIDNKSVQAVNTPIDTEKLKIDLSEQATAGIMQRFDDLSAKIEQLENKVALGTQRKTTQSQSKRESDEA